MTDPDGARRIAIIGMGPRGLGAAEALLARAGGGCALDVFEPCAHPGAGPNFSPDESPLCLLNLPVREVRIAPRNGVGSFADWLGTGDAGAEDFVPRAVMGSYLEARFAAMMAREDRPPRLIGETARRVLHQEDGWWIETDAGRRGPYREVLLTQGQPATEPDPQLARWQDHAGACGLDLLPAYPADALLEAAEGWAGKQVGLRGLGLSTLDVLRLLTCGLGGRFDGDRYIASGREPARILPFSLDGHAPAPKPADARIDARFDPLPQETEAFERAVAEATGLAAEPALERLCAAMVAPVRRVQGNAREAEIEGWLASEREAPGSQETRGAVEALEAHVAMARGARPPDIGYAAGQLLRKWQDAIRRGFNPRDAAPETAARLVRFDNGMKRYSYGPPLRSAEEMLTLIRAGIVDLRAVDDPDIALTKQGWQLADGDAGAMVSAMVDAVLPSPRLGAIRDPLVTTLCEEGWLHPLHEKLGAATAADGRVRREDGSPAPGLALLGRLAQGSVIAVDSIHDCFGAAADRWAEAVLERQAGQD